MKEDFQALISIIPIAGFISLLLFIIKSVVNSLTAHELDRLFSTSWNKFVEMSIAISLVSISYFVLITTEIFKIEITEFTSNPKQGLLFTLTLLFLIIWAFSSLIILGRAIYKGLCKQFVYYIIESNGDKWKIEKFVTNEKFYVSFGDKKKVLKIDDNTVIQSFIEQSELGIKIYSKVKSRKVLFFTLYSLMLITIAAIFITSFIKVEFLIVIAPIALYLIILLTIIKIGYDDYVELSNTSNQSENNIDEAHSH